MKLSINTSYTAKARLKKDCFFSWSLNFTPGSLCRSYQSLEVILTKINDTELCFLLMKTKASDVSEPDNTTHTFIYFVV